MPQPAASFTSLAGVPVHYARPPVAQYGTRGVSHRFHSHADFTATLERCFAELWDVCPEGRAEVITSAGAYVNKPGQHGGGRAFDLDGIFWSGRAFVTLNDGFNAADRKFYYGVECILRRHFGQVLNFEYNAAHRDHFHIDAAQPVGLRTNSTAVTLFVQGVLRTVYGAAVAIDGAWGSTTADALTAATVTAGMSGAITSVEKWRDFLLRTAARAFSHVTVTDADPASADKSPAVLLQGVYDVIQRELGGTVLRKPVESALDAFSSHPATQAWLEKQT